MASDGPIVGPHAKTERGTPPLSRSMTVVPSTTLHRFGGLVLVGALLAVPVTSGTVRADDEDVISKMSAGRIERIVKSFSDVTDFTEVDNNTYSFQTAKLKIILLNKGDTMQLHAAFKLKERVSFSRINEWNKTKRFAKAYLDKDGDPVLEADIELTGGVTEKNVKEWLKTYVLCLKAFRTHISE